MSETMILLVSRDDRLIETIETMLAHSGSVRLHVTAGLSEAYAWALANDPGLIVVHDEGETDHGFLARMLSIASPARGPLAVVVLSQTYHPQDALSLYQMGITDYLSLADHGDRLASVIETLAVGPAMQDLCPPEEASRPRAKRGKSSTVTH